MDSARQHALECGLAASINDLTSVVAWQTCCRPIDRPRSERAGGINNVVLWGHETFRQCAIGRMEIDFTWGYSFYFYQKSPKNLNMENWYCLPIGKYSGAQTIDDTLAQSFIDFVNPIMCLVNFCLQNDCVSSHYSQNYAILEENSRNS